MPSVATPKPASLSAFLRPASTPFCAAGLVSGLVFMIVSPQVDRSTAAIQPKVSLRIGLLCFGHKNRALTAHRLVPIMCLLL